MRYLTQDILKSYDQKKFSVNMWCNTNAKYCIQIVHGMSEHSGRYNDLAEFFLENGGSVYSSDHRGHGLTQELSKSKLGYFSSKQGWKKVIQDIYLLNLHIRKENPGVPVIVIGHSMGSFLSMNLYLQYANTCDALVLSGSTFQSVNYSRVLFLIIKIITLLRGKKSSSKLIRKLSFDLYNNYFAPNKSQFDWLCSDPQVLKDYIEDQKCGFFCTNQLWLDLMGGMIDIFRKSSYASLPKKTPIYILGGEKDPVSSFGKGIVLLEKFFKDLGFQNVSSKVYANKKHEIFNEIDKNEIFNEIYQWIRLNFS